MKFDLHTHHFRCGHADGSIRDYIEAGINAGLGVIGISDHTPYFGSPSEQAFPKIAMAKSELVHYVEEVLSCRKNTKAKLMCCSVLNPIISRNMPNSTAKPFPLIPLITSLARYIVSRV